MEIKSRLDIGQLFWEVDELCKKIDLYQSPHLQLESSEPAKPYRSRLSLSEVTTIVIAFQASGRRTCKDFYTLQVQPYWRQALPQLVSDNRFVELMPSSLIVLGYRLDSCRGEVTGISFVDSTPIEVCHPCRSRTHRQFEGLVGWGKNSMAWHYGFKLHLIINDRGELLAYRLTAGNVDDHKPLPNKAKGIFGKLFGDRGDISQKLFEQFYGQGLILISRTRKNMKRRLLPLWDQLMLRKRSLIETVNDQLKNICQIEHSRHRSIWNFLVNLLAGLVAYRYLPKKPSLHLDQYQELSPTQHALL